MIHEDKVKNYSGTMQELAEEIGNLRYDALSDFLNSLAEKIQRDGDNDESRGRIQLASYLHNCSTQLTTCKASIDKAWKICKPYMK